MMTRRSIMTNQTRIAWALALALLTVVPALADEFTMPDDADLVFVGGQFSARAGTAVAFGDLNDDGLKDAIVGEPSFGNGEVTYDQGRVAVYWGGGDDVPDLTIRLAPSTLYNYWELGSCLAVGDVNGDGIDDVIYSAPFAYPPPSKEAPVGVVFVTYGRSSWSVDTITLDPYNEVPALADVQVWGGGNARTYGLSVASGDLNDDGFDDIIATSQFNADDNHVWTVFGEAFPSETELRLATDADLDVIGEPDFFNFGYGLAAGDVTGDGTDDLLIGAPGGYGPDKDPSDGRAYILYGSDGWTEADPIDLAVTAADVTIDNLEARSNLGWALTVGDINGDGTGDAVVSEPDVAFPSKDKAAGGTVYVIHGNGSLPATIDFAIDDADLTIAGDAVADIAFGFSLDAGDINGDCIDDLLIGSRYQFGNLAARAYGVYGATDLPATLAMPGDAAQLLIAEGVGDQFGTAVALGDFTGDLLADMLVGDPMFNDATGAAYLVYSPEVNEPPIADAGADQTVDAGVTVTLDGTGSSDPEGRGLTFAWTQVSGPSVTLNGAGTDQPTFDAADAGTYVFELTVDDCLRQADDEVQVIVQDVTDDDSGDDDVVPEDEDEEPGFFGTGGCGQL
jgi:hypothetical protein